MIYGIIRMCKLKTTKSKCGVAFLATLNATWTSYATWIKSVKLGLRLSLQLRFNFSHTNPASMLYPGITCTSLSDWLTLTRAHHNIKTFWFVFSLPLDVSLSHHTLHTCVAMCGQTGCGRYSQCRAQVFRWWKSSKWNDQQLVDSCVRCLPHWTVKVLFSTLHTQQLIAFCECSGWVYSVFYDFYQQTASQYALVLRWLSKYRFVHFLDIYHYSSLMRA